MEIGSSELKDWRVFIVEAESSGEEGQDDESATDHLYVLLLMKVILDFLR